MFNVQPLVLCVCTITACILPLSIIVRIRFLLLLCTMDIHDRVRVYDIQRRTMMIISLGEHRQTQRRREKMGDLIRFHSILPLREVDVFLVLLRRPQPLLVLKERKKPSG